MPHNVYPCPLCDAEIEVTPTTPKQFHCWDCLEDLEVNADASFDNGHWRDLTRLISHKERMVKFSEERNRDLEWESRKDYEQESTDGNTT